jgi:hypothetical protein
VKDEANGELAYFVKELAANGAFEPSRIAKAMEDPAAVEKFHRLLDQASGPNYGRSSRWERAYRKWRQERHAEPSPGDLQTLSEVVGYGGSMCVNEMSGKEATVRGRLKRLAGRGLIYGHGAEGSRVVGWSPTDEGWRSAWVWGVGPRPDWLLGPPS